MNSRKIRPMNESDAEWICEMLGNKDVTRLLQFIPIDRIQFLAKHKEYLRLAGEPHPLGAFVLEEDGVRAGYAFLRRFAWEDPFIGELELGYLIDPAFWNNGIGTALSRFLLERAGNARVLAIIDDRNTASERIVQKLGFRMSAPSSKYAGNSVWST